MVAQKRAASRAAGQQANGGKHARKEDVFTEDCGAVLTLLERDGGLDEATRGMLRQAFPHALVTPSADRHDFQKIFVDALAGVFKGVEVQTQASSDAATAKVEDAVSIVSEAAEAEKAAVEKVEEKKSTRDDRERCVQEASAAVSSATAGLDEVRKQEGSLQGDYDKAVAAHAEHESFLADSWAPLKVGNWPGKQWRERNKLIEKLQVVMEVLQMEETLRKSLPYALKAKVEERGAFAQSSMDFTEKDLREHLASLKTEIDGHDAKVLQCRNAVEAAEQTLKTAEGAQEGRLNNLKDAEDALGEAKESHKLCMESVKAAKVSETSLSDVLSAAKAELGSINELLEKFKVLCESGKAVPQALDEAAAAE